MKKGTDCGPAPQHVTPCSSCHLARSGDPPRSHSAESKRADNCMYLHHFDAVVNQRRLLSIVAHIWILLPLERSNALLEGGPASFRSLTCNASNIPLRDRPTACSRSRVTSRAWRQLFSRVSAHAGPRFKSCHLCCCIKAKLRVVSLLARHLAPRRGPLSPHRGTTHHAVTSSPWRLQQRAQMRRSLH